MVGRGGVSTVYNNWDLSRSGQCGVLRKILLAQVPAIWKAEAEGSFVPSLGIAGNNSFLSKYIHKQERGAGVPDGSEG